MSEFQWQLPCDPSDLVYFRQRIGPVGVQRILQVSAHRHGDEAQEPEVVVDTTVQEKNITYPTDSKLAHRALRKMKVIAGRLVRELERKLPDLVRPQEQEDSDLYRRLLKQQPIDRDKIYSLHEPQVYCLSKGKEHKKYEFGSKASVVMTKTAGVIVGALAHAGNLYDGDALAPAQEQTAAITGQSPCLAIVDRGYRGRKTVNRTQVPVPDKAEAGQSKYLRAKLRAHFGRRAAIEPLIGHLKSQYRLARCFFKGFVVDQVNLLLAVTWNLRKWLRTAAFFWLQTLRAWFASMELPLGYPSP